MWESYEQCDPKQMPPGSRGSVFPSVAICLSRVKGREGRVEVDAGTLRGIQGHRLACHH